MTDLRAPFPWFGGKRRVADVVWRAFGRDVPNYIDTLATVHTGPPRAVPLTAGWWAFLIAGAWICCRADNDKNLGMGSRA